MRVIKRDGSEVPFEKKKIWDAIAKADAAGRECGLGDSLATVDIQELTDTVEARCRELHRAVNIEEIQDFVEDALVAFDHHRLMRLYSRYRRKHEQMRTGNTTDSRILSIVACKNEEADQENANKNPHQASTQRDYIAGETSRDISCRLLLPEDIVRAHEDGMIHNHK